jgi:serine/threonine protein kinase
VGSKVTLAPELLIQFIQFKQSYTKYDYECDIWSLGVLFYQIVALVRPFNGKTDYQLCMMYQDGKYAKLLNKDFQKILEMMLQIDPKQRKTIQEIDGYMSEIKV